MGKPVVYCDKCYERIPSEDFDTQKAATIDGLHYCARCKPTAVAVPTTRPQPAKPTQAPPITAPRAKPAVRPRVKKVLPTPRVGVRERDESLSQKTAKRIPALYLAGGIGLLIVIAIVAILLLSSPAEDKPPSKKPESFPPATTKPPQPTTPELAPSKSSSDWFKKKEEQAKAEKIEQSYKDIIQYARTNPTEFYTIISKIEGCEKLLRTKFTVPEIQARIYEINVELKTLKETTQQRANVWSKVTEIDLAYQRNPSNYEDVIKKYTLVAEEARKINNSEDLIAKIDQRIAQVEEKLNTEISENLGSLEEELNDYLEDNRFEEALWLLEDFPEHLKNIPEVKTRLEQLRKKVEDARAPAEPE